MWTLIQKLQQDPSISDTFTRKIDSLWYKYPLYICRNSQLEQNILLELHNSLLGRHIGFLKTYHRVKKEFFGDGLKSDIQKFVVECLIFQQNKVGTIKNTGLLQLLTIASEHWEEISMDFIKGLPKSEGKVFVMVVVDIITKYAHLCAPSKWLISKALISLFFYFGAIFLIDGKQIHHHENQCGNPYKLPP